MSRMKKFNEFLQDKAKVSLVADYPATSPSKPASNGNYPGQPKAAGGGRPYAAAGKDKGLVMAEPDGKPPLAHAATPGLTPEKSAPYGKKPAGRPGVQKTSKRALKEFVEATKGMSDSAFMGHVMNEGKKDRMPVQMVHDLSGEQFTPHPHEAIGYICSLMHNPKMVSRLVREAKRHGHMESLVQELMDHPEFFDEAVKMMGDRDGGRKVTDKLARTMFDHHSSFKKDAGFHESYKRRQRILTEKVADSMVDGGMDPEEAGIPMPDDENGSGERPEMDSDDHDKDSPEGDDAPPDDDASGEEGEREHGDEPDEGESRDGLTPAHGNMLGSLHGQFGREAVDKYCKDGNC